MSEKMSVITKLENFWNSVSEPRYNHHHSNELSGINGKLPNTRFDRTSRRCQSSLNIHSHGQEGGKRTLLQRKLSTPHQHGNAGVPCRVCEENKRRAGGGEREVILGYEKNTNLKDCSTSSLFSASGLEAANRKSIIGVPALNQVNQLYHHAQSNPALSNHQHQHPPRTVYVDSGTLGKFIVAHSTENLVDKGERIVIESLEDKQSTCPNPDVTPPSTYESVKMRKQKSEGRPQSLEYSQRKAWLRMYRDLELAQVSENGVRKEAGESLGKSPKKKQGKARSKSILHLHRLDSQASSDDVVETMSNHSDDSRDSSSKTTGPSLFQRFSKTFSMRFGSSGSSGSNGSNKQNKNNKKVKYPVGSSPDLYHRNDDDINRDTGLKWRQNTNLTPQREEKCRSGDSGIGIPPEDGYRRGGKGRVRKTKSDNFDGCDAVIGLPPSPPNRYSQPGMMSNGAFGHGSPLPHIDSPISRKLSLVEIPDHTWEDPHCAVSNMAGPAFSSSSSGSPDLCKSLEDLGEGKMDDDGFVSSEELDVPPPAQAYGSRYQRHGGSQLLASKKYPCSKVQRRSSDVVTMSGRNTEEIIDLLTLMDTPANMSNDGGIRGRVVADIVKTEHNYIKTLNDIVQGFLIPCRKEKALFSLQNIENIFSNIEDILRLHTRFLKALVSSVDKDNFSESMIGHIFTLWADEFDPYCDYCCSNPISNLAIKNLMGKNAKYGDFFEACRRLQYMDKLPLHGFLLRPIQRICQYQLQLQELFKKTDPSHKDYESTKEALDSMKKVAEKVNDTQRLFDTLLELMDLQLSMDLFEGPNLMDKNNSILYRGDLAKAHQGKKHKDVHVILLSSELIFCKRLHRDITKRNSLLFLGRIDLSNKVVCDIDSSREDPIFGTVHNSWRIYSKEKTCWVLFTAMTAAEKSSWLGNLSQTRYEKCPGFSPEIYARMRVRVHELVAERNKSLQYSQNQTVSESSSSTPYKHNTLPKSRKSKAAKQGVQSNSEAPPPQQTNAEAMLIEVGKLKRNSCNIENNQSSTRNHSNDQQSNNYNHNRRCSPKGVNRHSVFYV